MPEMRWTSSPLRIVLMSRIMESFPIRAIIGISSRLNRSSICDELIRPGLRVMPKEGRHIGKRPATHLREHGGYRNGAAVETDSGT